MCVCVCVYKGISEMFSYYSCELMEGALVCREEFKLHIISEVSIKC